MILRLVVQFEDGREECFSAPLPVLVGRGAHCELQISSWRIAREHARFSARAEGCMLEDLGGMAGTFVNGRRIGVHGPLRAYDEVLVGPCKLRLQETPGPSVLTAVDEAVAPPLVVTEGGQGNAAAEMEVCRKALHHALILALDVRRRDVATMTDAMLRGEASALLAQLIREQVVPLPPGVDCARLSQLVLDEAVGLGVLETLLADTAVTEIMVNGHDRIYVEREGRLQAHGAAFSSEAALRHVLERIVSPLGRRIDEAAPMVDARLADGSRVNAVIPPIATRGTCLTIRKFSARRLDMPDLIAMQALDERMAAFLLQAVRSRRNIVVAGGTGAGKTTLLNVLSNAIPEGERIVTIEDAAELRLAHEHLVALEARPANVEGQGCVEIRDLVRNALRMRPDRIVVGECRGGEAFDMLTAMNTGHEGSLTTLHANSPRDALARLESMVLMAGLDLPVSTVREYVAACVDVIVQQARGADGRRRIVAIAEVCGIESGTIQLQDLFLYDQARGFYSAGWQAPDWQEGP